MHKELFGLVDFTKTFLSQDKMLLEPNNKTTQNIHFMHTAHYHDNTIQFSGILYNREMLKKQLAITTSCLDATLIMIAYERWGISLLEKLEGIFAFALFDKKNEILYLAKDHVSVEPLYYYHDNHTFLFGNALKQLASSKGFEKSVNIAALSNYFTFGYIMQPNTIYQNCYKIKSGYYLQVALKSKKISENKYWDLGNSYDTPKSLLLEQEIKDKAESLLKNSIHKRVDESKEYAALLSGGYDSSTITALLQEASNKKIKTFTIGFEDESINEAPEAKKIAKHLGTEHIEHYFTESDALEIIPKLSEIYDEPFYDNGSIPTTLLASIAKEHNIETIFAGDGGDEVFATADDIERYEHILALPYSMRNRIFQLLNSINPSLLPYIQKNKNIPTKYYKFINIFKAKHIPRMVQVKMTLFHPYEINQLVKEGSKEYQSIFDTLYFGEYAQSVDKVIGTYFKTFMTDGELIKTTQAFRAQNITIREPYLDKELIDFMATVPSNIKIKDGTKKYILKQIAHDYIPKELLNHPKKGFSVPFSAWMRGVLNPLLMETLSYENLQKDGILEPSYVIELRNRFLNGKEEYKYKLWSILLYQLWYEKNFR